MRFANLGKMGEQELGKPKREHGFPTQALVENYGGTEEYLG